MVCLLDRSCRVFDSQLVLVVVVVVVVVVGVVGVAVVCARVDVLKLCSTSQFVCLLRASQCIPPKFNTACCSLRTPGSPTNFEHPIALAKAQFVFVRCLDVMCFVNNTCVSFDSLDIMLHLRLCVGFRVASSIPCQLHSGSQTNARFEDRQFQHQPKF